MLCLKEANLEDMEKEYQFITNTPEEENGFTNPDAGCTRDDFRDHILPGYLRAARGEGLPEGWVPETRLFLWDGDDIVGLFRIRHYLNEALANGAGHIGYGIGKEFRGKGYASLGLRLALQRAWDIIREEEIYLSVHKDNPASLRAQLKNGAYIHHESDEEYFTRIRRPAPSA